MIRCTSCKIALSNTFCGATAVFEYRRNDRFCMQNARRVSLNLEENFVWIMSKEIYMIEA